MKKLLAILITAVLLLTLGACDKKEEAPTLDPSTVTEVAETFWEAYYLRDYATRFSLYCYDARGQWEAQAIEDNGSAEGFFAQAQKQADEKGIDVTVDSFDSYYAAYHQFFLDDVREQYGENTVTVTATDSVKMSEDLLPEFCANIINAVDEQFVDVEAVNAISEAYTVTVHIVIDGEIKDYSEHFLVQVVNYNGQWLVGSHSA